MKTITINGVEYEQSLHTEMDVFSKIVIPDGWRLLTFAELMMLWNEHKNKFDFGQGFGFDEVVEQPNVESRAKYPYWNVWLRRLGGGSASVVVGNYGGLDDAYGVRGVRFCREKKRTSRKMKQ